MIPENEQNYLKKCWRCGQPYMSRSSFFLETCQECWTLLAKTLEEKAGGVLIFFLGGHSDVDLSFMDKEDSSE